MKKYSDIKRDSDEIFAKERETRESYAAKRERKYRQSLSVVGGHIHNELNEIGATFLGRRTVWFLIVPIQKNNYQVIGRRFESMFEAGDIGHIWKLDLIEEDGLSYTVIEIFMKFDWLEENFRLSIEKGSRFVLKYVHPSKWDLVMEELKNKIGILNKKLENL